MIGLSLPKYYSWNSIFVHSSQTWDFKAGLLAKTFSVAQNLRR